MATGICTMTMVSSRSRLVDVLTVFSVLFGWVFVGIGEFFGLWLLWSSKTWSRKDKIIGTLIPAELGFLLLVLILSTGTNSCSSRVACTNQGPSTGDVLLIVLLIATLLVAISSAFYLVRQVYQRPV
jgi:hypothetical protein